MKRRNTDSFVGEDGFHYVYAGDDIGYLRESPDTAKAKLYYESFALEKEMLDSIETSTMSEPTKSFCIFSVKISQLDRLLNEFYDNSVILCSQPNPMAKMLKPSQQQKDIWSGDAEGTKAFVKLSLGQKHQILRLLTFIADEDSKRYKKTMATLHKLIARRNDITHALFNSVKSTDDKRIMIQRANNECSKILTEINHLDGIFAWYIFRHLNTYYQQNE